MNKVIPPDIVIDANAMRLYDKPKDISFINLFSWVRQQGVLTVNQKLIKEYGDTRNDLIMVLLNELSRDGRLNRISKETIAAYKADRHYAYTCNAKDRVHARTVFLSNRKRLIAIDKNFLRDINNYPSVDGVKPCAYRNPKCCPLN